MSELWFEMFERDDDGGVDVAAAVASEDRGLGVARRLVGSAMVMVTEAMEAAAWWPGSCKAQCRLAAGLLNDGLAVCNRREGRDQMWHTLVDARDWVWDAEKYVTEAPEQAQVYLSGAISRMERVLAMMREEDDGGLG